MKRISLFLMTMFVSWFVMAQILDPVKWSTASEQISSDEYVLSYTATIEDGWYIYSQHVDDFGPEPTSFTYTEGKHFIKIGDSEESGPKKVSGFDVVFEMNVTKYAKMVTFTQKVKVNDLSNPIEGYLTYMTCDDNKCLAPTDVDFSFSLKDNGKFSSEEVRSKGSASENEDTAREEKPNETQVDTTAMVRVTDPIKQSASEFEINATPIAECGEPLIAEKTNWGIFLLGFLGGLIALLTPCVFPMIPLTVSFFTKGDQTRKKGIANAALYGGFIFLVYLLLSLPFHLIDNLNPDILNELSTNVFLNILFFIVFLVFAFSFFGYYELTLPSSWTNRASQAESVGGVIGVFFMALTLSLVSFSCTGPILGSLLAGALTADGGAMQLTSGMAGFGLALALPFALFAAFPGWMKNLPKSGGWMGNLKVALGFIELALALKFLSNADLVKHWGILKIEVFLVLWILIFLAMAIYFFRKFRLKEGILANLIPNAGTVGVLSMLAVIYLATGFRYSEQTKSYEPLTLLSGLAPPVSYSIFYPTDCPQNLTCFKNLDEGVEYAREIGKPIMLDFTGHACVNCRKMEEHVWPKKEVYNYLKNDFVLVSLYVDDRTELKESERVEVEKPGGGKRKLRTVGQRWAHFQTSHFNINSQPYYALMTPEGQVLNHPVAYTPDASEYAEFLKCGLEAYREQNR